MLIPTQKLCEWKDPSVIATQIIDHFGEAGFIWLDGDGSKIGRYVVMAGDPIEEVCSRGLTNNLKESNPFEILSKLNSGHWTGWLSYEAAAWTEPKNPWKEDDLATLWIARHDPILKFDLVECKCWLEGFDKKRLHQWYIWLQKIDNSAKNLKSFKHSREKNQKLGNLDLQKSKELEIVS